jgi:hypothetical protein
MLVLTVVSCHSTVPDLKPPKAPDEYRLPPPDARFSEPVTPPKEKFQEDLLKSKLDNETPMPGPGRTPGAAPGMTPGRF